MKTNLKNIIKRVLNEEVTETEPLYWKLPEKLVKELEDRVPGGLKLYRDNDIVYLQEIWFDTRKIIFALHTKDQFGIEISYDESLDVPGSYSGYYSVGFDGISKDFKRFIFRRLDPKWLKYLF
jgi:hypothetical protein